jgi:hypothetical protein
MIFDQIYKDYIAARKEKNQKKSQFLGYIRSELANRAKELKQEKLKDPEALRILKKQEKKLKEAKESSKASQREDIKKELEIELETLSQYLPEQLSLEKTEAVIDEIISKAQASSISDMGKVMKKVLAKIGAQSNPKEISEIVRKKLSS